MPLINTDMTVEFGLNLSMSNSTSTNSISLKLDPEIQPLQKGINHLVITC